MTELAPLEDGPYLITPPPRYELLEPTAAMARTSPTTGIQWVFCYGSERNVAGMIRSGWTFTKLVPAES